MSWFLTASSFIMIGMIMMVVMLATRLYPNGNEQPLTTVCQVDAKLDYYKNTHLPQPKVRPLYDGWFMIDETTPIGADIIETTPDGTQIKIKYNSKEFGPVVDMGGGYYASSPFSKTKWLPIEEFHKNYTTEELSEMVRELQAKNKRKK